MRLFFYRSIFLPILLCGYSFVTAQTITTGTVSNSLCAHVGFNVPFTITGSFTPGNVFTAYISDANGSFANQIIVGVLSSTTAGSIPCNSPAVTYPGSKYRIRVVSSSPAVTGTDNGSDIVMSVPQSWSPVGVLPTSTSNVNSFLNNLVFDTSDVPYLLYSNASTLQVRKFDGANWTQVGSQVAGSGSAKLVVDKMHNDVYLVYATPDNQSIQLLRYNGNDWVPRGQALDVYASSFDATASNDTVYVVYWEPNSIMRIQQQSGTSWSLLPIPVLNQDYDQSICADRQGNIYMLTQSNSGTGSVIKGKGASWSYLGGAGAIPSATGNSVHKQITVDNNGTPYISFINKTQTVSVMKYNGASWVYPGADPISPTKAVTNGLCVDTAGQIYAVIGIKEPFVMGFDGSDWKQIGGSYAKSLVYTINVSIVMSKGGIPHVAGIQNSYPEIGTFSILNPVSIPVVAKLATDAGTAAMPTIKSGLNSLCVGNNSTYLMVLPGSLNGAINWKWYTGGCATTLIDSSSIITVSPDVTTTYYVRGEGGCVAPGPCATVTINSVPDIGNNTVLPATQVVASGLSPTTLIGSAPSGSDGVNYTFTWQKSLFTTNFSGITGTNTISYSPAPVTQTTYFRRIVSSGGCAANTSAAVSVIVPSQITNNLIGSPRTTCVAASIALTGTAASGGYGTYNYQWQSSVDGINFTDIVNASGITYTTSALTQTTWFTRVVNSGPYSNTSAPIKISLNSITQNAISQNQSICTFSTPLAFTGNVAGGNGSYSYQWLQSTDNIHYSAISGAVASGYGAGSLTQTTWYRRKVVSGTCTDTSVAVKINVTQNVTGNQVTAAQTICAGTVAQALSGTIPSGGDGANYSYSWQQSTDNGNSFTDIAGGNLATHSPGALTQTTSYRRNVSSGACTNSSNTITITVNAVTGNTLNPAPGICTGNAPSALTGSNPSGGNGNYTYSWQQSADSVNFTTISNATAGSLAPGVLTQTVYYRRIVTSLGCNNVSPAIPVVVSNGISNNTIGSDQTICGTLGVPLMLIGSTPSGGSGVYTYDWQTSSDNITFNPTGANAINYSPPALVQTTYFKRIVSSGGCSSASSKVTVVVNPAGSLSSNTISADQEICTGNVPAAITGTTVTGGNGISYNYTWESSTDNNVYTVLPNITTTGYTPAALTRNTWFRRVVYSGGCNIGSSTIKITVDSAIVNTISGQQTICSGSAPAQLKGDAAKGGNGNNYSYNWQYSTDGVNFLSGSNNTLLNYSPAALTQTTWYRRIAVSGACTNASSVVAVTVTPVLSGNLIGADQTVCANATAQPLTATTVLGGEGSYHYQWQSSSDNISFGNIDTALDASYLPGKLTQTTWFKRMVFSGGCSSVSDASKITVNAVIGSNAISGDQTLCEGSIASPLTGILPTGGDGAHYSYAWLNSSDNKNYIVVAGANTINYSPPALAQSKWYKRVAASGGCSDTSAAVSVHVDASIRDNTAGDAQSICSGTLPAPLYGSNIAGGDGKNYSYQWQLSTDSINYTNIAGAIDPSYAPLSVTQTTWYRRVVVSGSCTANTPAIKILVNGVIANNTVGSDQTICGTGAVPQTLQGSLPTGGNGNYQYQWQISKDSNNFTDISGAITGNYDPPAISATTYFRRKVVDGCTSLSNSITVTINSAGSLANNKIESDQRICSGATPAVIIGGQVTGGTGNSYTYQWQSSSNNSIFSNIPGTNQESYVPPAVSQTMWYRRIAFSGLCNIASNPVEVHVDTPVINNTISADQLLCTGVVPALLHGPAGFGSGSTGYLYKWFSSTDSINYFYIDGTADTSYQPAALTTTTWFERLVATGACTVFSPPVKISVGATITGNIISTTGQLVCAGITPVVLNAPFPAGGNGVYAYQWQRSADNIHYTDVSNATAVTYSPDALTQTAWFRRTVRSGNCSDNSPGVKITVQPALVNQIAADQNVCAGNTPSVLTGAVVTGGDGSNYSYQWQISTDSINFTTISGAGISSYASPPVSQTGWYRRQVISGACISLSNRVKINVGVSITGNTISSDQTICGPGGIPFTLSGPVAGGGDGKIYSYQWQSSTDNINFTNIAGAITADLDPAGIPSKTWFRRLAGSGGCTSISNVVAINVNATGGLSNNTINGNQQICTGTIPAVLTGSTVTGATSYQWQVSNNNSIYTNVAAATASAYAPPAVSQNTWYRRIAYSGSCNLASGPVIISVSANVTDNYINASQEICQGVVPAALSGPAASGGSGVFQYQWLESKDSINYNPIVNASGTGYYPGALTQTSWYKRSVSSGYCTNLSEAVRINISKPITGNTAGNAQAICEGTVPAPLTGSSVSGGNGSNKYRWLQSGDDIHYAPIAAAGNINYAPAAMQASSWYKRIVLSGGCTDTSSGVKITVSPVIGSNSIAASQSICAGFAPALFTGSVPSGGNGAYAFQWLISNDSTSYANIPGAISAGYASPPLLQTTEFERIAVSGGCNNISPALKVSITALIRNNTISGSQVICANHLPATLEGSLPDGGNGIYTYRWLTSTDSIHYNNTPATGISYPPSSLTQTTWYKRIVNNAACNDTSVAVKIKVNPLISGNLISADQIVCEGNIPATLTGPLPSGGDGIFQMQWLAGMSGNAFVAITGAASASFSPPALNNTTYYKRTVYSGGCADTSNTVTIKTSPPIINNTITGTFSVCPGIQPPPLSGSVVQGGDQNYSYQWELSTDSIFYHTIAGASLAGYQPPVLSQNTWYKRLVSSGGCTSLSEGVSIHVFSELECSLVNVFSPNGDGINDTWVLNFLKSYPNCTVEVYDRNGKKIFSSHGYTTNWDGKYNGRLLPAGVYYFIINKGNGEKQFSGSVTILY
ncbi:MAG: gliding motility-associated C-terminal domain-containing protein [Chitinophagaceae bacterium]|nr:gliding motility-associated C-terminal domain-containing protein [Chitinophagaceae bacterium]